MPSTVNKSLEEFSRSLILHSGLSAAFTVRGGNRDALSQAVRLPQKGGGHRVMGTSGSHQLL